MNFDEIVEDLRSGNWESLSSQLENVQLYAALLQNLHFVDLKEALSAFLVRGMDPLYLDLCVRDLAWKRELNAVEILLSLGANPCWAAVGFALFGDVELANQYWSVESALEGAAWKGPVLIALKEELWFAMEWMSSRGADLKWIFEADEIVGCLPALTLLVNSLDEIQSLEWETLAYALNLQLNPESYWTVENGIAEEVPLSDEAWALCERLLERGYVHAGFSVLAKRQGKFTEYQSRGKGSMAELLAHEPLKRDFVRLLISNDTDLHQMKWLEDLAALGLNYFKLLQDSGARLCFAEELMYGRLERLKNWWPQLSLAGLAVQDLLKAALRARRVTWLNWILSLAQVDQNDEELLQILEAFPPVVKAKIFNSK